MAGREAVLSELRERISRLDGSQKRGLDALPFDVAEVDGRLPHGGLPLGALHEALEAGHASEHAALSTLFVAGILARLKGPVLWCLRGRDLFAPALSRVGLHPDRVIYCETWKDAEVLPAMEEGLRHAELAGVVGEANRLPPTAARRLQFAAETSGVPAFIIRRFRTDAEASLAEDAVPAVTRWRIAASPSPPPAAPGLGRARWRVELLRCRGAEPHSWILEACDASGRLAMPADVVDRPLRRVRGGAPPREQPMATVATIGARRLLASVDRASHKSGLRVGMTATQAQTLVPNLHLIDATPDEDVEALTRLALWCSRYSPLVTPDPPDGLFIDVAGSSHLFKGEEALIEDLRKRLNGAGFTARASVADTPGCAYAMARYARQAVVAPGATAAAIASLPVAALRLPHETIDALSKVGVDRIAQLAALPRGPLKLRYGAEVLLRLDQALGAAHEPLRPLRPPELPSVERRFFEPLVDADNLAIVVGDLCGDLCTELERRGVGARRLDLVFARVDRCHQAVRIGVSRPAREPKRLAKLLCERLVLVDPGFGVDEASLTASWVEALSEQQTIGRHVAEQQSETDVAGLVDTLSMRLGDKRIYRAEPVESDIPERSVKRAPALAVTRALDWPKNLPRPPRLISPPEPVQVVAQLPDHPPALFVWKRLRHRVASADGPERILGEWWRDEAEVSTLRDYYRVETIAGERFWLFRDGAPEQGGRWFLHGLGDA